MRSCPSGSLYVRFMNHDWSITSIEYINHSSLRPLISLEDKRPGIDRQIRTMASEPSGSDREEKSKIVNLVKMHYSTADLTLNTMQLNEKYFSHRGRISLSHP